MADAEVDNVPQGEGQKKSLKRPHEKKSKHLLDDNEEASLAKKLFGYSAESDESESDRSDTEEEPHATAVNKEEPPSVWRDEDDEETGEEIVLPRRKRGQLLRKLLDSHNGVSKQEYQDRLKSAFQRTHNAGKIPTWAKLPEKEKITLKYGDEDDEVVEALVHMTRTTEKYLDRDTVLPRRTIDAQLLSDLTVGHSQSKSLNTLLFHETKPVLVTGYESGVVALYQVDSEVKKEHFLQSAKFKNFPITSMAFLTGGNSLLCGSRRADFFHRYDLETGKFSQSRLPRGTPLQNVGLFTASSDGSLVAFAANSTQIYVLSASSMEFVASFATSSIPVSISFYPGSRSQIWVLTENGTVDVMNIQTKWLHSFYDEGAVKGTTLTFSRDGSRLACGSNTGIVNIYETKTTWKSKDPKPLVTSNTLLTSCRSIAFSHDCQLMASISDVKKSHAKLVHIDSGETFMNFPSKTEKFGNPTCVKFSPHSGYMALGCSDGKLRTYRMSHYDSY